MNMLIRRDENTIDKTFRKKLYDAKEEVPLHLWDGVRVNTKRKRRPIFWWFVASMTISVACVTALILAYSGGFDSQAQSFVPPTHPRTGHSLVGESLSSVGSENVLPKSSQDHLENFSRSIINQSAKEVKDENVKFYPSKNNRRTEKNIFVSTHAKSLAKIESDKTHDLTPVNDITGFEFNDHPEILHPNGSSLDAHGVYGVSSGNVIESAILDDASLPLSTTSYAKTGNYDRRMFAGLYYSVGNPFRLAANGANKPELSQLNQRTEMGHSTNLGMSVGYYVFRGLFVSAGVESFSFKENHSWYDTTITQTITLNQSEIATYPNADTIAVFVLNTDTIQNTRFDISNYSHMNRYSSVNIPLLLGYQLPLVGRISVIAQAGPVLRFERRNIGSFVFADGYQPRNDMSFVADATQQSPTNYVYLNSYYANWRADMHTGLSLAVGFADGWSVQGGAQCRWMMKKSDEIKSLSHRIIQPGVHLGLSYRF